MNFINIASQACISKRNREDFHLSGLSSATHQPGRRRRSHGQWVRVHAMTLEKTECKTVTVFKLEGKTHSQRCSIKGAVKLTAM